MYIPPPYQTRNHERGQFLEVSSDGGVGRKFWEGCAVHSDMVNKKDAARRDSIIKLSVLGSFFRRGPRKKVSGKAYRISLIAVKSGVDDAHLS